MRREQPVPNLDQGERRARRTAGRPGRGTVAGSVTDMHGPPRPSGMKTFPGRSGVRRAARCVTRAGNGGITDGAGRTNVGRDRPTAAIPAEDLGPGLGSRGLAMPIHNVQEALQVDVAT